MAQLTAEKLTAQQLQELKDLGTVTVGSKAYEEAEGRFYVNLATKTASISLTGEYIKDWGTGEKVAYRTAESCINDYYSTGALQLN